MIRATGLILLCACSVALAQEKPSILLDKELVGRVHAYVAAHGEDAGYPEGIQLFVIATPTNPCGDTELYATQPLSEPKHWRRGTLTFSAKCKLPYQLRDRMIEVMGDILAQIDTADGKVVMGDTSVVLDGSSSVYPSPEAFRIMLNIALKDIADRLAD